jgi:hypothetical protein
MDETVFESFLRKRKEKKNNRKIKKKDGNFPILTLIGLESDENSEVDENVENDPFFQNDLGSEFDDKIDPLTDAILKKKKKNEKKEQKEKEAKSKADLELLMVASESKSNHFTKCDVIKNEKKRRNKKGAKMPELPEAQEDFQIDLEDPRFSNIVKSHTFSIDPTNPQFKKTKAMQLILSKRRDLAVIQEDFNDKNDNYSGNKEAVDLSKLVNSVKRKAALTASVKGKGKRRKT